MSRVALAVVVCLLSQSLSEALAAPDGTPDVAASRAEAVRMAAAGQRLYQEEGYAEALEKFRRAYVLYPSPDLLVYIAACLMSLRLEIEGVRVLLDFFVDPGQSKQELRGLAIRLWQQANPASREALLGAGVDRLPVSVRRKLDHLPLWQREQLPPELRRLLLEVQVAASPADVELVVDGLASPPGDRLYLTRGRHRLRAIPRGAGYLPRELEVDVSADRQKLTLALPLVLRVRSAQGRAVAVDERAVPAAPVEGLWQESLVPVSAGFHEVRVVSPRGRRFQQRIEVVPGRPAEVSVGSPLLWPGLALASAGIASLITGAALLSIDGSCATPGDIARCERIYQTAAGGYAGVAIGAAALGAGAFWFAYGAIDHPYFRRTSNRRLSVAPATGGGLLQLSGRY